MHVGQEFLSYDELENAFHDWCTKNYHPMKIGSSHKIPNTKDDSFPYESIRYACKHSGVPRPRGQNKRPNQKYYAQNCPAILHVSYIRDKHVYRIMKLCDQHNHPIGERYYRRYPEKRRLTFHEALSLKDLFTQKIGARRLAQLIQDKTGKLVTAHDISNIRQKYRETLMQGKSDTQLVIDEVSALHDENIQVFIETTDDSSDWIYIILQTHNMVDMLKKFYSTLFVGSTNSVNIEKYPLFSVLCENEDKKFCPVCYIFVKKEDPKVLQDAFTKFTQLNPDISDCSAFVTVKDFVEVQDLQTLFPRAKILLCTWHLIQHLRTQVNNLQLASTKKKQIMTVLETLQKSPDIESYQQQFQNLKDISPASFYQYFTDAWDSCKESWALCYRLEDNVTGNNFNNKMANYYSKLKQFLKPHLTLTESIKALLDYCKQTELTLGQLSFLKLKNSGIDNKMERFQIYIKEHCNEEAVKLILDQINMYQSATWEVDTTQLIVTNTDYKDSYSLNPNMINCNCQFQKKHSLPCCHIIALREALQMDLFSSNIFHEKWKKNISKTVDSSRNNSIQPCLESISNDHTFSKDISDSLVSNCKSLEDDQTSYKNSSLSLTKSFTCNDECSHVEKFCEAQIITNKLASFLSKCSNNDFYSKLSCVKNLLQSWEKKEQIILCSVKSNEASTSLLETSCYMLSESSNNKDNGELMDHMIMSEIDVTNQSMELDTVEEIVGS